MSSTSSSPFPDFSFTSVTDLEPGQRWSTWADFDVSGRGPRPWPDWVITTDAVDTELGILKTGKEADVFLLERANSTDSVVMAAKRYRGADHRSFHRDTAYVEGRRIRNSRDRRAIAKGTAWGRVVEADSWARAEFGYLSDLYVAGVPVPYPVQLVGTEILMEFVTVSDGSGAPRLAQTRPDRARLASYWEQLVGALRTMAGLGLAHGDLSAFNLLAADDRLVLIDLPQAVDLVANPRGMEFLARDCRNVATWFTARGLEADPEELLADLVGRLY